MPAYYNEIDSYAAQWLRNLIAAGHIAPGDVDERSIEDVRPDDLRGYTQCHFFAGFGGWAYALDLAGWPRDRPVWTGSCPCQPFSAAGKGAGFADERHLWPAWQHLINQCRPAVIFGEQVASKAVDAWIDLVHADLEGMGYAFGCVPFPSAGVGAPHIRDRTYWVADTSSIGRIGRQGIQAGRVDDGSHAGRIEGNDGFICRDEAGVLRLADAEVMRRTGSDLRASGRLPAVGAADIGGIGGLADASDQRLDGRRPGEASNGRNAPRIELERLRIVGDAPGPTNGFWRDADWLACTDGKWRPVEPGTFPLAHGASSRVGRLRADQERLAALLPRKDQGSRQGRLRGYGNAIDAEAARNFVMAYREAEMFL